METWKPINNIEGYEVSSHGQVRSLERKVQRKGGGVMTFQSRILKQTENKKGYLVVYPSPNTKSGYKHSELVHRLVAEAFIPNLEHKPQVNHKDGNKQNNHVDNLEWVTNLENHIHKLENNLYPETHVPKRVAQYDLEGNLIATFDSLYSAAKSIGVRQWEVSRVVNGQRKRYRQHVWKYV